MISVQKAMEKAVELIKRHDYARIVSHYDADGITSAGIICNALLRREIQFHTTIVSKLEDSFIQGLKDPLIIICDMGTAQLDLISAHLSEKDVIIIDHHTPPLTSPTPINELVSSLPASFALINPYLPESDHEGVRDREGEGEGEEEKEIEGDICAAGLSYLVARRLSSNGRGNIDLAGLAVAGTLGDKLRMDTGTNKMILDEGIKEGVISVEKGLKLGDGKIRDLVLFSTDPYIPLAGKVEWVDAFLKRLDIEGDRNIGDLDEEEERRLTAALLSLSGESNAGAAINRDALVGDMYILNAEVVRRGIDLMRMVDACGRFGKAGVGIGLCLRDGEMIEAAVSLYMQFQSKLVSELNRIESGEGIIKELPAIFYFYVQERGVTGILDGIVAEYLYPAKPVIALNMKTRDEKGARAETKISARCSKKLIAEGKEDGIDLAKAMEKASKEVGGFGGGHPVAAGASIPNGSEDKFIVILNRTIEEQKGRS
jgi:single-stranded DNA-specific DHH superfamily exonuclease